MVLLLVIGHGLRADLHYHPMHFELSTDKTSYYEGEKITFLITITNTDKERTLPVVLPHTHNTGQKLFYLNAYDKAQNALVLRYTEDQEMHLMVHDTGTVKITYLRPGEQVVVPLYFNDFENYFSYHTQPASHHRFSSPLFAGEYRVNVCYNPYGLALGDSIYTYYNHTEKDIPATGKQPMPANGLTTQLIELKIKRSADTVVTIERENYYIKTNGHYYYYFTEPVDQITTDSRCVHITSLPADSSSTQQQEYFYSQFLTTYNEVIMRFADGDIREYRKYTNWCPGYLHTERFNDQKQKILHQEQLPDGRYYSISYHQPGGNIDQETYCSPSGTLCTEITYRYNKKGELIKKQEVQTEPCIEVELNGEMRSVLRGVNLEGG